MRHTPLTRRELFRAAGVGAAALTFGATAAAQEKTAGFTLPDLPYPFEALEPHIDKLTMETHHGKHHKTYVNALNMALAGTDMAGKPVEEVLMNLAKVPKDKLPVVRNNGGGHFNHSLFWKVMCPAADSGKPAGALADAIASTFKDVAGLQGKIKQNATTQFGSGWAWLVVDKAGKLVVTKTANQDNPLMNVTGVPEDGRGVPILGVDVWEHAYYLKYKSARADYVDAWFNVVNWQEVGQRYEAAVKK